VKNLKIEMVHDVVCSWCPIGYANLQQALRNLNIDANIFFLPSELNPDMGPNGENIDEYLSRRYQWTQLKRQEYRIHLLAAAGQAGVAMDFSKRTRYYNSNKAHRLIHWSEAHNKQQAMNELLIGAYFERGLDISNTQVLLGLAEKLVPDNSSAELTVMSHEVDHQMRRKQKRVDQLGLTSVPAFIFNENKLVSGSNSVEYFEQTIKSLH